MARMRFSSSFGVPEASRASTDSEIVLATLLPVCLRAEMGIVGPNEAETANVLPQCVVPRVNTHGRTCSGSCGERVVVSCTCSGTQEGPSWANLQLANAWIK